MDYGWAQYKENFAVARSRLFHLAGNFVDCQHLDLLGRDVALHEGERFSFARALEWLHTNTIIANNDLFTHLHFVHWLAKGTQIVAINDDGHVHFYAFNRDPLPVQAHLRWQIRRGVEFRREHAVLFDGHRLRVFAVYQRCPKLLQFREDKL